MPMYDIPFNQPELDEDLASSVGTSEYAREASRSLLSRGNSEDLSDPTFTGIEGGLYGHGRGTESEASSLSDASGMYQAEMDLDEDAASNIGSSGYAAESQRLLLAIGRDGNISRPFPTVTADDDEEDLITFEDASSDTPYQLLRVEHETETVPRRRGSEAFETVNRNERWNDVEGNETRDTGNDEEIRVQGDDGDEEIIVQGVRDPPSDVGNDNSSSSGDLWA